MEMERLNEDGVSSSKCCVDKYQGILDDHHSAEQVRCEKLRGGDDPVGFVVTRKGGSVIETSNILRTCTVAADLGAHSGITEVTVDDVKKAFSDPSAWSGVGFGARKAHRFPVDESPNDLAIAAASNDIGEVGRLLGPRDVNAVYLNERELPGALVRRPLECSLLDVAVGSGSVEMTKYLLEFHSATPTRETLMMAISTGNLELISMMVERLTEASLRDRTDLMEVTAGFHQHEVLVWLLRDATVFVRELLGVFAMSGSWQTRW
jgi:hypothetical protein